jgi:hypothetical protein
MTEKAKLSAVWASVTEVLARLEQMQELQQKQRSLLDSITDRIQQRQQEMETSLGDLTAAERLSITSRATGSLRRTLLTENDAKRTDILRQAVRQAEEIASIEPHYGSSVQMIMRDTLGSDRRSTFGQQIATSGPAELAALASYSAATKDADLAAALCSRNAALKASERSFSSSDLADALVGDEFRQVATAIAEIQILAREVINADRAFLNKRPATADKIGVALMRSNPADTQRQAAI